MIVMKLNYPGLTADDLTNEQKEHIRAIATLASGLVGAATGNSFEAATTAAAAGYNAAVNNSLATAYAVSYTKSMGACLASNNTDTGSCGKASELQAKSYKDAGFYDSKTNTWNTSAIKEWQGLVTDKFEKEIYPLCQGNSKCLAEARADRNAADVTDAGNPARLYQMIGLLKTAYAVKAGDWGSAASGVGLFAAMTAARNTVGTVLLQSGLKVGTTQTVRFGPVNPGPLPNTVANTFRGGAYTQTTLSEPIVLYRVSGGSAGPIGQYWTTIKPAGPLQSQIDLALKPSWGNTATQVTAIKVPVGQTIFYGSAASQGGAQIGGGSQVFIPRVNSSWMIK
jgi:hypothetical protein